MVGSLLRLMLLSGWVFSGVALANGPGDDLFKLVPADAGVTLAVEDLRGHVREIGGSPLLEGLKALPAVQSWLTSDGFRKIERVSREVTTTLGYSAETLREDLLGDAVILTLQPGPSGKPDDAHGLLLIRPRNQSLVPLLVKALNEAQTRSGELVAVEDRTRGPLLYKLRKFKPGGKPNEYYVQLDDGSFAWSNSEPLIQGVIDRKLTPGSGLGDNSAFREVRRGLSDRPFVSLFVNPRLVERVLAGNVEPAKPSEDRHAAMLVRYVGAIRQLGLSLEWRDGIQLHSHEVLIPDKLDPWLKHWLAQPASPVASTASLPPSAVAVLSSHLDFEALRDAAFDLISEPERPRLENLKLALQGLLLGHDPVTDVLPRLGPGALVYVDVEPNPALKPHFPLVGVVSWSDQPGAEDLVAPLDNALRTAFALYALDSKKLTDHLRVESRIIGDSRITSLTDGAKTRASYRLDRNRLVLGNSPEAVARFGTGQAPAVFARLRGRYFPEAETFAIIDLRRLVEDVRTIRRPLTQRLAARSGRPVDEANKDLGQLISLAELFQAATFSATSTRDTTELHRSIRLIAR